MSTNITNHNSQNDVLAVYDHIKVTVIEIKIFILIKFQYVYYFCSVIINNKLYIKLIFMDVNRK